MKTWKILKGDNVIAYVSASNSDPRDTSYYALQLVRRHFYDYNISGTQLLSEMEEKQENIPTLDLYYPERFALDGIEYMLTSLHCALWTSEAFGFCKRLDDGSEGWLVNFDNKEDLKPVTVELPLQKQK